jgi:hypothetical protein
MSPTFVISTFLAVMGFAMGCGSAQFSRSGMYSMGDVGGALLVSIATFMWVREDAWRRSFVGLTPFVLPYYLCKTRGLGRGLIAIGIALALYALTVFSAVLGVLFIRSLKV